MIGNRAKFIQSSIDRCIAEMEIIQASLLTEGRGVLSEITEEMETDQYVCDRVFKVAKVVSELDIFLAQIIPKAEVVQHLKTAIEPKKLI